MASETTTSGLLQDCKIKTKLKNADVTGKLDYMNAGYETDIHDLTPGNVQSMINSISLLENNLSSFALQLNSYVSFYMYTEVFICTIDLRNITHVYYYSMLSFQDNLY